MIIGKTESGFEYTIEDDALDDYDLLENMCEVDNGNAGKITDVITGLLGKEQKEKLKNHLREKNGRVPTSKMIAETMEILKSCKEGKKS